MVIVLLLGFVPLNCTFVYIHIRTLYQHEFVELFQIGHLKLNKNEMAHYWSPDCFPNNQNYQQIVSYKRFWFIIKGTKPKQNNKTNGTMYTTKITDK